jgi:hypothetical protein
MLVHHRLHPQLLLVPIYTSGLIEANRLSVWLKDTENQIGTWPRFEFLCLPLQLQGIMQYLPATDQIYNPGCEILRDPLMLQKLLWFEWRSRVPGPFISTCWRVQLNWFKLSKPSGDCLWFVHLKDPLESFKMSKGISPVLGFQFWPKSESLGLNGAQLQWCT